MRHKSKLQGVTIDVVYLARGVDRDSQDNFEAFARSYKHFRPGIDHKLYIVFKGFSNAGRLGEAHRVFSDLVYTSVYVEDKGFDLGAYFVAALHISGQKVLFCNTASEICGHDWLLKLAINYALPGVGLVGCTGSFEAPSHLGMGGIVFPNPHIRSNAFMIDRKLFIDLCPMTPFLKKDDVHMFEHGPHGMTRRIAAYGLSSLVVGKDGRGYQPFWWPESRTFRQGTQSNLLVADNQTRRYQQAPIAEKQSLFRLSWGDGAIFHDFNQIKSAFKCFGQIREAHPVK